MPVTIPTEDAVWISGALYCKTPEALEIALDTLREIGYEIKDLRTDSSSITRGETTPEQMEKNNWSLWYASLKDLRFGKCNSCKALISTFGIQSHGHTCEACGKVTYLDITSDSTIRFTFVGSKRGWLSPDLRMNVKRWDTDNGWLYLHREFSEASFGLMGPEEAEAYLEQHAEQWEAVEEDGQQLIRLHYHLRKGSEPINPETVINVREIWGHHFNYKIVKVWDGVEYPEHSLGGKKMPVPDSVSIHETWHWAPLEPSPTLHVQVLRANGNTADKGWHYQDGTPWFRPGNFVQMGLFIRHFTTLDADEWDRVSTRFRMDGPGGIDDVANFCHPNPEVEDRPNVGNFLHGASKVLNGKRLTNAEAAAMSAALNEDPDTQSFAKSIIQGSIFGRR